MVLNPVSVSAKRRENLSDNGKKKTPIAHREREDQKCRIIRTRRIKRCCFSSIFYYFYEWGTNLKLWAQRASQKKKERSSCEEFVRKIKRTFFTEVKVTPFVVHGGASSHSLPLGVPALFLRSLFSRALESARICAFTTRDNSKSRQKNEEIFPSLLLFSSFQPPNEKNLSAHKVTQSKKHAKGSTCV